MVGDCRKLFVHIPNWIVERKGGLIQHSMCFMVHITRYVVTVPSVVYQESEENSCQRAKP